MKKAALPLYAMLVTGCLACFQTDDNLNVLNLTAYVSGKHIGRVDGKTIIVAPGTPKISIVISWLIRLFINNNITLQLL